MLRLKSIGNIYREILELMNRNTLQNVRSVYLVQNRSSRTKGCNDKDKPEPIMDIRCKSVVFTSGCTGIGYATANQLLGEGVNHVFLSGMDMEQGEIAEKELQRRHGDDKATFIPGDIRDDQHLKALFEICMDKFEHVDIFVNDAGILQDRYWKRTIDTNTAGVLRACLLGTHYMGKSGLGRGGVMVNLSSVYGLQPLPAAPVHSASKYAVVGITLNLGEKFYYNKTCLRFIAVCPGLTDTPHIIDLADKQYNEEWGEELDQEFCQAEKQAPEVVGKAISYAIKFGPTASIWIAEECKLYLAEIPDRRNYCKMVSVKLTLVATKIRWRRVKCVKIF